jgi:hypothetical protein
MPRNHALPDMSLTKVGHIPLLVFLAQGSNIDLSTSHDSIQMLISNCWPFRRTSDPLNPFENDWISGIREASIYSTLQWKDFKDMFEAMLKKYIDERSDSPQIHQTLLSCSGPTFVDKFYPQGLLSVNSP